MNIDQTHVLLWSQSQSVMHIEPKTEMLKKNRIAFLENRRSDYLPMVFGSLEQCRAIADLLRPTVHERQLAALERNQSYGQGNL